MSEPDEPKRLYDITRPISAELAGWPGDTPYRFSMLCRLSEGASVNLGSVEMSPHTGTHIDAPYHYDDQGKKVGELRPAIYIGPAAVLGVEGRETITRQDIPESVFSTSRLLLRTGGWEDGTRFPERIPVLDSEAADWIGAHSVELLGFDLPSVDQIDSKDLPIHHALGRHGIAILEGLDLRGVPDGFYELIALPLRLEGADGSPVRAILRSL